MRRATRFLIRLYPASWRERYGKEVEALIEDSSLGWTSMFDLLKGAVKMRLHVPAFPKLAVILSLAGLAAGFGASWLVAPTYVSGAEMRLTSAAAGSSDVGPHLAERVIQMEKQVLSRTSLKIIIQDPRLDLYKSARERMPLEDVIEQMRRRDIVIPTMPPEKENVRFLIRFRYPDPWKARATVQALVTKFSDTNYQHARMSGAGENLDVLEPPTLPAQPAEPNRMIFAASGFGAGFAAALVVAVLRRRPPPVPFPAQTA